MHKKIAFLTDTHLGEQFTLDQGVDGVRNLEAVLNDVRSKGITEVICGGDIGDPKVNAQFIKLFDVPQIRFRLILGNHDKFHEVIKHFQVDAQFVDNELFYSEKVGQFKYVFMDSSSGSISRGQQEWLKTQLVDEQQVVIFIHHPLLKVNTPVDDEYPLSGRDTVVDLLTQSASKIYVCCGHYHMADSQVYRNINQYVSPAVSYQFVKNASQIEIDNKRLGYSIIEINDDDIAIHPVFLR